MLSLAHLDRIIDVDVDAQTITVQAGCTVREILDELKKHGLTLANFSSIQEQQIGGWMQVAAHGTGASLPTVEEQIVRMRIVTPAHGAIELTRDGDRKELFDFARAGLGCLGVVSSLTLQCVPRHALLERSFVTDVSGVAQGHVERLKQFRHVRYMWIPYTDRVVVITSNPHEPTSPLPDEARLAIESRKSEASKMKLVKAAASKAGMALSTQTDSFTEARDIMLGVAPLDTAHVKKVNEVEALYWEMSAGWRMADSTEVLGFDCGGAQWVLEVAFPLTKDDTSSLSTDLAFIRDIMAALEAAGIPAPSPIEQRWTSSSTAKMSPAFSEDARTIYSWVGVIMYLPPSQSAAGREAITRRFREYTAALEPVYRKYSAVPHWAKIEPKEGSELGNQRAMLQARYNLARFNQLRQDVDPQGVLLNDWAEKLFK